MVVCNRQLLELPTSPAVLTVSSDTAPESVRTPHTCTRNRKHGHGRRVGTRGPACLLAWTRVLIPSATGLRAAPHPGEHRQGWCQSVSQLQPGPPPPVCFQADGFPPPPPPPFTMVGEEVGVQQQQQQQGERARGGPPLLEEGCPSGRN